MSSRRAKELAYPSSTLPAKSFDNRETVNLNAPIAGNGGFWRFRRPTSGFKRNPQKNRRRGHCRTDFLFAVFFIGYLCRHRVAEKIHTLRQIHPHKMSAHAGAGAGDDSDDDMVRDDEHVESAGPRMSSSSAGGAKTAALNNQARSFFVSFCAHAAYANTHCYASFDAVPFYELASKGLWERLFFYGMNLHPAEHGPLDNLSATTTAKYVRALMHLARARDSGGFHASFFGVLSAKKEDRSWLTVLEEGAERVHIAHCLEKGVSLDTRASPIYVNVISAMIAFIAHCMCALAADGVEWKSLLLRCLFFAFTAAACGRVSEIVSLNWDHLRWDPLAGMPVWEWVQFKSKKAKLFLLMVALDPYRCAPTMLAFAMASGALRSQQNEAGVGTNYLFPHSFAKRASVPARYREWLLEVYAKNSELPADARLPDNPCVSGIRVGCINAAFTRTSRLASAHPPLSRASQSSMPHTRRYARRCVAAATGQRARPRRRLAAVRPRILHRRCQRVAAASRFCAAPMRSSRPRRAARQSRWMAPRRARRRSRPGLSRAAMHEHAQCSRITALLECLAARSCLAHSMKSAGRVFTAPSCQLRSALCRARGAMLCKLTSRRCGASERQTHSALTLAQRLTARRPPGPHWRRTFRTRNLAPTPSRR